MPGPKSLSSIDFSDLKGINLTDGTDPKDAVNRGQLDANATADRSRANHTGSQTAATISDFDTAVRLNRLDQLAAPTGSVALNTQRITGLADPTAAQDAATRAYVDAQLSGAVSGLTTKGSVRAAVTGNVNIASPGTTLDGLTAVNGDIFLLTGQTTGSQNGPYVFNGSGAAMTRATNWDTNAEAVLGSYWIVREGTNADRFALLTNDTAITLGTSVPAFTFTPISGSAAVNGASATSPATAAGGTWTITHNLNTRLLTAQIWRNGSPWDLLGARIELPTVNTAAVLPDVALASGEYIAVIGRWITS